MDLLRFITAGSVDDGKSTLIGRLLYDSKNVLVDQLDAIERQSRSRGSGEIDLALLTDGLRAEREQGITIDIAYKYFSTPRRKFIIADAPGHVQYTRNMVTGASTASLVIVLVDARKGVTEQTRRHSMIASILGINQVVLAVNKMDLVDFREDRFIAISQEYAQLAGRLGLTNIHYIPMSALSGDNIVGSLGNMNWYPGPSLLDLLETVPPTLTGDLSGKEGPARFQVQYVIRPQLHEYHDYRGFAGRVLSGHYFPGQQVTIFPSGRTTRIKTLESSGAQIAAAYTGSNIIIGLEDAIDVSRGDLIADSLSHPPELTQELDSTICWMDEKPLKAGNRYIFQLSSKQVIARVQAINYKLDVNTYEKISGTGLVSLNEIAHISLKMASPMPWDKYKELRANGAAILIDENTLVTVGACMLG